MTDLTSYIKQFASLNRAPGATWTEATKRKAPHKPLLLLAVLDLVHRGVITSPFIAVTGDLVELNELFNLYWRRIIPLGQTSSIAFPFSRLDREPFWELVPQPVKTMTNTNCFFAADQSGKSGLESIRKTFIEQNRQLSSVSGFSAYHSIY